MLPVPCPGRVKLARRLRRVERGVDAITKPGLPATARGYCFRRSEADVAHGVVAPAIQSCAAMTETGTPAARRLCAVTVSGTPAVERWVSQRALQQEIVMSRLL